MNKFCWDLPAGWYNFPNIGEPSRNFFYCNDKFQNVGCQTCPAGLFYSAKCEKCLYLDQGEIHHVKYMYPMEALRIVLKSLKLELIFQFTSSIIVTFSRNPFL